MIISLDTEVTGLDLYHGARPYIVTTCQLDDDPVVWEWDVNPITRKPEVPEYDLQTILDVINNADEIVCHNLKYDACALIHLYKDYGINLEWPWHKSQDTVLCGHLLASNHPHNLTDMVLEYLSTPSNPVNIEPFEIAVKEACNEARGIARRQFPKWRIAKKGEEDMPSAKGEPWKNDMWLPLALAKQLEYSEDHPWYTVTRDYAIHDSFFTVQLWRVLKQKLEQEDLWPLYEDVRRKLPRIQNVMESRGVTLSATRLEEQIYTLKKESEEAAAKCVAIAKTCDYDLIMPKSGNNDSLHTFIFDTLQMRQSKWSEKTGRPSLDKGVLEAWELELDKEEPSYDFIHTLMAKRKRDTAVSYLEGYTRFWLPNGTQDFRVLHPNTNPTGTDTLRWSFNNPNTANLSKQKGFNLRYVLGPATGREWYSMDAKNIELRIPAYEAREPDMMYIFDHPNDPPYFGSYHLLIFDLLHPDLYKEHGVDCKELFEDTWYQWVKNGNFAIQYGAQEKKADATYHVPGAFQMIRERFTRIAKLNDNYKRAADKYGCVETIANKRLGHKRGYPLLCTRTDYGKVMPTVPFCYHVSGTAMDWMQNAMIACQDKLDEWNAKIPEPQYFMILQVHDALVFDFPQRADPTVDPKRSNLWRVRELQKCMESCGENIGIPTPVDVKYHPVSYDKGISL